MRRPSSSTWMETKSRLRILVITYSNEREMCELKVAIMLSIMSETCLLAASSEIFFATACFWVAYHREQSVPNVRRLVAVGTTTATHESSAP